MKVIIYESSSKGGCYEYAQYLYRAFIKNGDDIKMILPVESILSIDVHGEGAIYKLLLNDQKKIKNKLFSKFSFLFRQFHNPIRFLFYLMREPASVVVWNDFEQITAPFWIPILLFFTRKHFHVIILHDPDRDNYPPSKRYATFCMKLIMGSMDLALYHGYLPDKSYYKNHKTIFKPIVHGLYDVHPIDYVLHEKIVGWKQSSILISVIGNIREEKNYELIIGILQDLPRVNLLIAGAPANGAINIDFIKDQAKTLGVYDRICWDIRFLSDSELAACIQASDIVLLYYKPQFTSQSGILNLLIPYNKQFIYTDAPSGLQRICKQYEIGVSCIADNRNMLIETINKIIDLHQAQVHQEAYESYRQAARWSNIIDVIQNNWQAK